MRIYEINYIISGLLSEDKIKAISDKLSGFVAESSGKVEKTSIPAKKSFGFKIDGQKDVYFNSIIFSMPEENISIFEKKVKNETDIARHNLLKRTSVESNYNEGMPRRRRKPIETSLEESPKIELKEHVKPKKVELKEIDQKIEEILNE